MPVCSVIGCGKRKTQDQPSLTMHRIPRNEYKKKKWLEAIGIGNIKRNVKDIYICSLHFDDKCFNKTLDVTRLRDDAIPFKFVRQHTSQRKYGILKENQLETIPVLAAPDTSTSDPLEVANNSTLTVSHAVAGTSEWNQTQKIKKLEDKCDFLKKKIKMLNETVRRQKKKIAAFQDIIKELQEMNLVDNENSIVLEACAGNEDFLKRQISKSEGLPLEEQYSEKTIKFALTLHSISPKAYNFVRRTYNTCLPHPRTLTRWDQKINAEPGLCEEAFEALQSSS